MSEGHRIAVSRIAVTQAAHGHGGWHAGPTNSPAPGFGAPCACGPAALKKWSATWVFRECSLETEESKEPEGGGGEAAAVAVVQGPGG